MPIRLSARTEYLLAMLRSGGQISVIYNDPENPGFFTTEQIIDLGSPYYTSVGDLNRDDWPDILVSHNGPDRYLYSQGLMPRA